MPGDVAVVPVTLGGTGAGFLQDSLAVNKLCTRSPEAKSGSMILIGPGKHAQSVQVRTYLQPVPVQGLRCLSTL